MPANGTGHRTAEIAFRVGQEGWSKVKDNTDRIKTIDKKTICDSVMALTHDISKMLYQTFCYSFGIMSLRSACVHFNLSKIDS